MGPVPRSPFRRWGIVRLVVFALLASALVQNRANASPITLSYVGNPFQDFWSAGSLPLDVYTTTDRVTGFVELGAPLGANLVSVFVTPLSYSFSDGVNTLVDAIGPLPTSFSFSTDALGQVTYWAINVFDARPGEFRRIVQTRNLPSSSGCIFPNCATDAGQSVWCGQVVDCIDASGNLNVDPFYVQQARIDAAPGVWTAALTSVPEASTLVLFGTGALGLIAARRRKPRA